MGPNAAAAFPFGVRVRGGVRVAVPFGVRAWRFPFGPVAGWPRPVGGASPTSWPWDALAFWPWAVCGGRFVLTKKKPVAFKSGSRRPGVCRPSATVAALGGG